MKQTDVFKARAINDDNKRKLDKINKDGRTQQLPRLLPTTGTAIVQQSVAMGDGSLCVVEVLSSSGQGTGLSINDVQSPSRVSLGDVVTFIRRKDGTYHIAGGGQSGSTSVTAGGSVTLVIAQSELFQA